MKKKKDFYLNSGILDLNQLNYSSVNKTIENTPDKSIQVQHPMESDYNTTELKPYINSEIRNIFEDMSSYLDEEIKLEPNIVDEETTTLTLVPSTTSIEVVETIEEHIPTSKQADYLKQHIEKTKQSTECISNEGEKFQRAKLQQITENDSIQKLKSFEQTKQYKEAQLIGQRTTEEQLREYKYRQEQLRLAQLGKQTTIDKQTSSIASSVPTKSTKVQPINGIKSKSIPAKEHTLYNQLENKIGDGLFATASPIGKIVYKDVYDDSGNLIAQEGEEIDEDILLEAKERGCLVQLIMKTYTN